jgi:hypothetical protein
VLKIFLFPLVGAHISYGKYTRMKKWEAVQHLWELADRKEAIIFLSDCLFVYP